MAHGLSCHSILYTMNPLQLSDPWPTSSHPIHRNLCNEIRQCARFRRMREAHTLRSSRGERAKRPGRRPPSRSCQGRCAYHWSRKKRKYPMATAIAWNRINHRMRPHLASDWVSFILRSREGWVRRKLAIMSRASSRLWLPPSITCLIASSRSPFASASIAFGGRLY